MSVRAQKTLDLLSGSIDWLWLPRFDSPAVFASILDPARGGRCQVRPTCSWTTNRRYIGHPNVLETTFTTASGVLRVTDLMPVDSEAGRKTPELSNALVFRILLSQTASPMRHRQPQFRTRCIQ